MKMEGAMVGCSSPLDIDVTLGLIIEALPSKDVVGVRLVSKRWEEVATNVLKKRQDVVIQLNSRTISQFLSTLKKCRALPFPCFKFTFVYYEKQFEDDPHIHFLKFAEVSGRLMKELGQMSLEERSRSTELFKASILSQLNCGKVGCLIFDSFKTQKQLDGLDDFQKLVRSFGETLQFFEFQIVPISENLESTVDIDIQYKSTTNRSQMRMEFTKYQELVYPFHELTIAEFPCAQDFWSHLIPLKTSFSEYQAVNDPVPFTKALKKSGILDKLTNLYLDYLKTEDIEELLSSNIALSLLTVTSYGNFNLHLFQKFLKKQRKSLEYLHLLADNIPDQQPALELPKIPELTELYSAIPLSFSSRSLQAQLPNLTKLVLFHASSKMLLAAFAADGWGMYLKVMKIGFADNFPCAVYLDCCICGFSNEWRSSKGEELLVQKDQDAILKEAEKWDSDILGGITRFPNLENVRIEDTGLYHILNDANAKVNPKLYLSDLAIYFSLSKLKKLRVLDISATMMSSEGLQYLADNIPELVVEGLTVGSLWRP